MQCLLIQVKELSKLLVCPLSNKMLSEPVIAADGITYERKPIEVERRAKLLYSSCPHNDSHIIVLKCVVS